MTRSVISALVCAATLIAASPAPVTVAQESRPRRGFGRRGPRVTSPEVSADRSVTFRLLAPKAEAVRLSGSDFPSVGRGVELTKGEEGIWEVTLEPVEPGAYRYRFDVDGVAVMDPRNPSTSQSNANSWSLVYVPGSDVMDTRDVPHGAVAEVTYYSRSLERLRRMHVYTPPGYESGTARYPILYLLHGALDCDDSWTSVGRAGFILDNLIAGGKAVPMVVVMPAGHTGPFRFGPRRGDASRPRRDEFLEDFLGDLMPHAEKSYRVFTDRKHRAIAGLSMGGGQTLNIAISHLEKFGYFGVFSSGVFGITRGAGSGPTWEERNREALDDAELKKGLELVWFATGAEDFLIETSRATVDVFRKHGFDVVFDETPGGHTWLNWRRYLSEFAPLLFRETGTAAAPTSPSSTSSVSGRWSAEFDTQIGLQKYVFSLLVDGKKVTGKATSEIAGETRETELTEGELSGDSIEFVEMLEFQGNTIRIEYSGKVSGDEIALTRKVGDFATETLVAARDRRPASRPARQQRSPRRRDNERRETERRQAEQPTGPPPPDGFDTRREDIRRGKIETVEYESKSIGIPRKMVVYTPPGYSTDRKYPVFYLLHGIGDDETHWQRNGSADVILDNLLADGKIEPMIVVMPNGRAAKGVTRRTPWNEQFPAFEAFEKDLLNDIIPLVESRYSVEAGRKHRALAGLSMGGGQSLNIGLEHLGTFGWVGGFSSAPNTRSPSRLVRDPARAAKELQLLWISCGNRDGLMRISRGVHSALEEMNVPHTWRVGSGGHTWPVWKSDLYFFSQLLFR